MTESQDTTINANLTPLPDKVGVDGLEDKWREVWDESEVYKFQGTRDRKAVYSIDTPPPTVSGHLHVGHVFSYTHTDVIARFKRMNGYDVFYPMGWDDNGLPTERRVQNYYGVRVDTSLKYDPDFVPPFEGTDGKKIDAKDQVPISRKNFIELCEKLTAQDEKQFEALWRSLGLSIDWTQTYHTIGEHPQRVAQKAFLRNLARGEAYQKVCDELVACFDNPDLTFSARILRSMIDTGIGGTGKAFAEAYRNLLREEPLEILREEDFVAEREASERRQQEMEAADTEPFAVWLEKHA